VSRVSHKMSKTKAYQTWNGMIQRCTNPNSSSYKNYGGRGIRVCKRWMECFTNFYEDMGEKPEGKTLDRIDNNGNYNKKNCRWATSFEQSWNRRNTIKVGDIFNTYEVVKIDYETKEVTSRCIKCFDIWISTAWNTTIRSDCKTCYDMLRTEMIEKAKESLNPHG
jgi:hypothetical protein